MGTLSQRRLGERVVDDRDHVAGSEQVLGTGDGQREGAIEHVDDLLVRVRVLGHLGGQSHAYTLREFMERYEEHFPPLKVPVR